MRQLVFNDDAARAKLNAIVHPAIFDEAIRQLAQHAEAAYQILAIPLLFENPNYLPHIKRILLIDCDENTQIARVKQRSQLSEPEIRNIIKAQTPREKRLAQADDVIKNDENIENLRQKILQLNKKYLNTCIVSKTI